MKKVNFPQFVDRARLVFIFEMDIGIVGMATVIVTLWIFSKFLSMLIAPPLAFFCAYKMIKFYEIAKYEMSPGFIRHVMYRVGLYKPKKDFKKYPELERREDENFYPSGYISKFTD
jgi:type IV conjugative transfer system protein TraL